MNTEKLEEMKKELEEIIDAHESYKRMGMTNNQESSVTLAKAILLCMEAMEGERGV